MKLLFLPLASVFFLAASTIVGMEKQAKVPSLKALTSKYVYDAFKKDGSFLHTTADDAIKEEVCKEHRLLFLDIFRDHISESIPIKDIIGEQLFLGCEFISEDTILIISVSQASNASPVQGPAFHILRAHVYSISEGTLQTIDLDAQCRIVGKPSIAISPSLGRIIIGMGVSFFVLDLTTCTLLSTVSGDRWPIVGLEVKDTHLLITCFHRMGGYAVWTVDLNAIGSGSMAFDSLPMKEVRVSETQCCLADDAHKVIVPAHVVHVFAGGRYRMYLADTESGQREELFVLNSEKHSDGEVSYWETLEPFIQDLTCIESHIITGGDRINRYDMKGNCVEHLFSCEAGFTLRAIKAKNNRFVIFVLRSGNGMGMPIYKCFDLKTKWQTNFEDITSPCFDYEGKTLLVAEEHALKFYFLMKPLSLLSLEQLLFIIKCSQNDLAWEMLQAHKSIFEGLDESLKSAILYYFSIGVDLRHF